MARRASTKTTTLDSVKVCAAALKQVKCAADYHRIGSVNAPEILAAAWEQLNQEEQTRIINIVNDDTKAAPQAIADELVSCDSKIELQTIKSQHGDVAVRRFT
jgi:hypothetical protein